MTHPSGFERRFRNVEYAHLKPVTHAVWMAQAPRRRWIGAQPQ